MADEPVVETRRSLPNAISVIVLTITGIVLLLFLWRARSLFLTVFLASIAGIALARAADWLEKHRVRRSIGAPAVMLLILGLVGGLIAMVAPTLRDQARHLTSEVPKAIQRIEKWLVPAQQMLGGTGGAQASQPQQQQQQQQQPKRPQQQGSAQQQPAQTQQEQPAASQESGGGKKQGGLGSLLQGQARSAGRVLFPLISSTFEAIAGLLIIIFLAIYIGISPHTYRNGIMHLVPHRKRARADEVLTAVSETLRGWLVARLIAMVVIGAITGIGLAVLGIKAALALALIAGLLELIPFFGPIAAAIPAIGVALVESPQKAIAVTILYLIIQQIEGNVLTPLLLKQRLEVPPVLTIVTVSALGIVFGVLGMLAAEPLTAVGLVLTRKLYVRDVIGDDVEKHKAIEKD